MIEFISRTSAVISVIILSPLLLTISFISIISQGFPIFFKHERVGYKFNKINVYKFRTMVASKNGPLITKSNDKRITTWGKVLRKLKLDEIPQLFNIILGEMRFIGPRPEVESFVDKNFSFLVNTKPGLSDFSSIIFRNEEEVLSNVDGRNNYEELLKIKVDLANIYSNHKSFMLDLKLTILTLLSIFFPKKIKLLIINMLKRKYSYNFSSKDDRYIRIN